MRTAATRRDRSDFEFSIELKAGWRKGTIASSISFVSRLARGGWNLDERKWNPRTSLSAQRMTLFTDSLENSYFVKIIVRCGGRVRRPRS